MVGQFKDDQFQNHAHKTTLYNPQVAVNGGSQYGFASFSTNGVFTEGAGSTYRSGDTTRTKQKGVKFIIKVL